MKILSLNIFPGVASKVFFFLSGNIMGSLPNCYQKNSIHEIWSKIQYISCTLSQIKATSEKLGFFLARVYWHRHSKVRAWGRAAQD